ncbi:hypothetical protein GQF61_05845 [Sphingobacterium sp. DK4209]|uniref:Uncharacterized protein n=1 Tax=Sphingobacterium zhuxiongii TaxID=2662364 RepID=A0A5Q0QA76_9SPHI|nr:MULTISPECIES: Imm27 family immunity protein [unclassified Sphingobacterium]MVZ65370.1 hypothetical protein [Sphingobacterium sp. DK4209]QGA26453.1 hypothetical protein GFH32_08985 [Sphingobacterium sp. dk4302]
MTELDKKETLLKGTLINLLNSIEYDDVSNRIFFLVENYLIEINVDSSGWNRLYKDPRDGRYWELFFSNSELQGGGAPTLRYLIKEEAIMKYNLI